MKNGFSEIQLAELMAKSVFFDGLTLEQCRCISEALNPQLICYEPNTVIFAEGSRVDMIGLVCSGYIMNVRLDEEGNQNIIQIQRQSKIIGLEGAALPSRKCPFTVMSAVSSEILFFPYDVFFDAVLPTDIRELLYRNMMTLLAQRVKKTIQKVNILSRRSLRERIWLFLKQQEVNKGKPEFSVCMSREELAQFLGVNRSALSNELSKMQDDGLIRYRKNQFSIIANGCKTKDEHLE